MASDPNQLLSQLIQMPALTGRAVMDGQNNVLAQQQARQQLEMGQMGLQAEQQKQQQEAAFQKDAGDYFAHPSLENLNALAIKYPQHAEQLKQAYASMDASARTSRQEQFGGMWSAASNGRADLVTKQLESLRTAEKAKGIDTSETDDMLAQLNSPDPAARAAAMKQVKGFAQLHLAAIDPAKFSETYGALNKGEEGFTLSQGQTRFNADGSTVASVAPELRFLVIPDDASAYPLNGAPALPSGGGDQPSGGAGGDIVARMLPITLGAEGGGSLANPRTSPKGARGPMQVMPGTNTSPGFGVTPAADDSEAERARVGKDYLAAMVQRYGDPAKAWAAYNAGPGAVDRVVAANGPRWLSGLPAETRKYVARNMAQLQQGGATGSGTTVLPRGGPTVGADGVIHGRPKQPQPPVGYRYNGSNLEPIPGGPADTSEGGLSPEEVNYYAQQVAAGGTLPSFGMGKAAARERSRVLGRAADINIDRHISGFDANLLHADLKANTHSLSTLANLQNQVAASERTASANADQVLKLGPQGAAGSVPVFNRWIQAGRHALSGDPAVSAYNAAITTFANEYAKVMTTNTGSGGVTSDSARREAESLINNAQTFPQVQAVIRQMRVDMSNRSKALETQRQILSGQINGSGSGGTTQPPVHVRSLQEAASLPPGTVFVTPTGQQRVRK